MNYPLRETESDQMVDEGDQTEDEGKIIFVENWFEPVVSVMVRFLFLGF